MDFSTDFTVRPPDRSGIMTNSEGRRLAWSEWGAKMGEPVLFVSGAATAGTLGFGLDCLDELGIRMIAPDRPGLGQSDPDPRKTLESVAADFGDLIRHLGAEAVPVAAVSQGVPFALALAATGCVQRLAVVSGQDELARPEFFDNLPDQLRQMVQMAADDPEALVEMLEGYANPDSFLDFILTTSSGHDLVVYRSEPFLSTFRASLKAGFRQGPGGYALDTVAAMRPWTFDWAAITCPVDLWYGGQDVSPVHSPDAGVLLAKRLKTANRHFEPEEGGSMLWTRSREILTVLTSGA